MSATQGRNLGGVISHPLRAGSLPPFSTLARDLETQELAVDRASGVSIPPCLGFQLLRSAWLRGSGDQWRSARQRVVAHCRATGADPGGRPHGSGRFVGSGSRMLPAPRMLTGGNATVDLVPERMSLPRTRGVGVPRGRTFR